MQADSNQRQEHSSHEYFCAPTDYLYEGLHSVKPCPLYAILFRSKMEVYFKPWSNRQKENAFFAFLKKELGPFKHIPENYPLPAKLLDKTVDVKKILKSLNAERNISSLKKEKVMAALRCLPNNVRVANSIYDVSVDFTIVNNGKVYFLEFHEKQHSKLTVDRATPIFCSSNKRYEIPRYAQRLIKDCWRWENLKNYTIVWFDWFDSNKTLLTKSKILKGGRQEFSCSDKFCFSSFCQK